MSTQYYRERLQSLLTNAEGAIDLMAHNIEGDNIWAANNIFIARNRLISAATDIREALDALDLPAIDVDAVEVIIVK